MESTIEKSPLREHLQKHAEVMKLHNKQIISFKAKMKLRIFYFHAFVNALDVGS
jgi:hypothetical protein